MHAAARAFLSRKRTSSECGLQLPASTVKVCTRSPVQFRMPEASRSPVKMKVSCVVPQDILQQAMSEFPDGTRRMIETSMQASPKHLNDHDLRAVLRSVVGSRQRLAPSGLQVVKSLVAENVTQCPWTGVAEPDTAPLF